MAEVINIKPPRNGIHSDQMERSEWMPKERNRTKAFGHWCREVKRLGKSTPGRIVKTPLGDMQSGSQGGYLVPDEVVVTIQSLLMSRGIFNRYAWIQPMNSAQLRIPGVKVGAAHATGENPLLGGMKLTMTQEGVSITQSEPTLMQTVMSGWELAGVVVASNPLVDDGGEPLGKFLEVLFTYAIEWTVEQLCFQGTGLGQPIGITKSPATKTITRNTASDVKQVDVAKMAAALFPECYGRSLWAVNPSAIEKIVQLTGYQANSTPTPDSPLCGSLLGRPLFVTQHLPVLGTQGDVMLFDPTMYCIAWRELEIASNDQTKFATNETMFRPLWRGDGKPILDGTATAADGTTTVGAFVALL